MSGAPSSDFGYLWREALFVAGAPADAVRIGWVLIDSAYSQRSTTVQLGQRLLRQQTALDGRSFDRGRMWLTEHGFVIYDPRPGGRGGSRSTYTLLLPEVTATRGRLIEEVPAQEVPADRGRFSEKAAAEVPAYCGHASEPRPTTNPRSNDQAGTTASEVDAALTREDATDNEAFLAGLRSLGSNVAEDKPSPFQPPALDARRVGEQGFVGFVKALQRLSVLDREEVLGWLAYHGATMRSTLPPLDAGEGVDDTALRELQDSLR